MRRVRNKLAVHAPNADGANRAGERNIRNAQRGGSAVDRENVRIVLSIRAEQNRNDLRIVKIAGGKQRPQRPIGHARSERFFFGGAAFTLEIAAGKFSDGRRLLAIIDREWKPILTFFNCGGGDCARHDDGIAARNDD